MKKAAGRIPDARDAVRADERALIERFLERAWSQSGLAENSLTSYRRDLEGLARWCARADTTLARCTQAQLYDYLAERHDGGYGARSNARLLSTLRHFYRVQQQLGTIAVDPTLLLDTPKLPRTLPKALSEAQVEALIRAPDVETTLGLRDRAMFELLYATGSARERAGRTSRRSGQFAPGRVARARQRQQGASGAARRRSAGLARTLLRAMRARCSSTTRWSRRCSSPGARRR